MTPTIRDQILDASRDAINAAATAAGETWQCVRTLMQPSEVAQLPAVILFPVSEAIEPKKATGQWGPLLDRTLKMRVVIYNMGEPADQALDPMVVIVGQALGGQQLDGLALSIDEEALEWKYDEQNEQVAAVAIDFRVWYTTLRNDPTQTQ